MRLYNSLTRKLEDFEPLDPQKRAVSLYVCGPTVYDVPHLGHLRSAYVFDVLRRVLARRYEVKFVRNVTDVDDKIIERARKEPDASQDLNAACRAVSERYLKAYHEALAALGIQAPTHEPKATEHVLPSTDPAGSKEGQAKVQGMTDLITQLLIKNVAYQAGNDVYFSVRKFETYGKLSNRTLDELQSGARVEPGEQKQDPLDFALWKAAKPGEPSWKSPWGDGRPGWHIECSAMSVKYLGPVFDIHGGGLDLIFPHHENEVAQAQAAGFPFARRWIHHGLLTVNGEKMSKSLGNYITLERAIADGGSAEAVKLFFLKTHYRSPADYSATKLAEAKKNLDDFSRFLQHSGQVAGAGEALPAAIAAKKQSFFDALEDDLNTPKALSCLFDWMNAGQQLLDSGSGAKAIADALLECAAAIGLSFGGAGGLPDAEIQRKIDDRNASRQSKDFKRADAIRKELEQSGILLTDTPNGVRWQRK